jgi:hypothetical protein
MAARNEDWILGLTARAALMWLDELVILDHASTDATCDIAAEVSREHPDRVSILLESNPVWEEMRHRQRMLVEARERGATHICYIDADEIVTGDLMGMEGSRNWDGAIPIRSLFRGIPPNSILQIPWLALRGSIGQVHTSGPWADSQNASFGFVDQPALHWSNRDRGGYDFHHRQPMGKPLIPWTPLGARGDRQSGLMHLQFVNGRRLRAKQAWYKIQEVLRWPNREPDQIKAVNQRYNLAVYGAYDVAPGWDQRLDSTIDRAPTERWWGPYKSLLKYFHPNALPWQETEVLKAIAEHGPGRFAGLDLFGIG